MIKRVPLITFDGYTCMWVVFPEADVDPEDSYVFWLNIRQWETLTFKEAFDYVKAKHQYPFMVRTLAARNREDDELFVINDDNDAVQALLMLAGR